MAAMGEMIENIAHVEQPLSISTIINLKIKEMNILDDKEFINFKQYQIRHLSIYQILLL